MTHAAPTRIDRFAATVRRPGVGRTIARTAGFNITATIASGLAGIVLARALGPTMQGEYAAITAWFGIALVVGQMGQPAALCFYVARESCRAREYVATSRAMTLITGAFVITAGIIIAPVLAKHSSAETLGYRIAFGCGSFEVSWLRCEDAVFAVYDSVDVLMLLAQVEVPVVSKSPLATRAPSFKMASAPSSSHLAPVMSILSLTMCLHAPSMIPVAIGQPLPSAVA